MGFVLFLNQFFFVEKGCCNYKSFPINKTPLEKKCFLCFFVLFVWFVWLVCLLKCSN